MHENGTNKENDYKETAFKALEYQCKIHAAINGVRVVVEELSGETHVVHINGSYKKMRKFTDDLYQDTKRTKMKWVKVFYEGMFGRWCFQREARRIKKKK